jgi:hypothetical protein
MGKEQALEWKELKTLEPGQTQFTANGKEYRIEKNLSFDRWRDFQKMEIELSFGQTMQQFVDMLIDQKKHLNKTNFADAAVLNQNLLLGVATMNDGRWPAIVRMCTLFINYKGEDPNKIDEATIQEKINDWRTEGYAMGGEGGFFLLALAAIPGFASAFQNASRSTSLQVEENGSSKATSNASPT